MSMKRLTCVASSTVAKAARSSRSVSGPKVVKLSNPPTASTRRNSAKATAGSSIQCSARLLQTRSTAAVLTGSANGFEAARRHGADVIFMSTGRVYPVAGLRALPLVEIDSRLVLPDSAKGAGWSAAGIAESFPLRGARTIYGATKLAAELLLQEYRANYGLRIRRA